MAAKKRKGSLSISHYQAEKLFVIVSSYVLSGVNFICAGIIAFETDHAELAKYLIFLGAIMLFMGPVSIWDKRKEMRGKFAAAIDGIMHLAFCIMLSYLFSWWWMAVYLIEVVVVFLVILIARMLASSRWRSNPGKK